MHLLQNYNILFINTQSITHFNNHKNSLCSNRFKTVIKEYDQTTFTQEALHRLVEINYKLGLTEESQKYANILGYNYLSSDWYKRSYSIFNKDYSVEINKPIKKDKRGLKDKFKKLFD